MASQKAKWKQELLRDFPNVETYFIDLVLDLYEKNPEYVKKLSKKKIKDFKPVEVPKEIVGACSVVNNPDEEYINRYFKPPITITEEN